MPTVSLSISNKTGGHRYRFAYKIVLINQKLQIIGIHQVACQEGRFPKRPPIKKNFHPTKFYDWSIHGRFENGRFGNGLSGMIPTWRAEWRRISKEAPTWTSWREAWGSHPLRGRARPVGHPSGMSGSAEWIAATQARNEYITRHIRSRIIRLWLDLDPNCELWLSLVVRLRIAVRPV